MVDEAWHGNRGSCKNKNKSILNQQKHFKLKVEYPRMTILPCFFIIVSPDLELDCVCHGKCLVKIKCPASAIGSKPDINNYKDLEYRNGV